jgi:pyrophosphatase PpaX
MIKAVFFDFDGTLVDTNGLIINSYKYAYREKLGIEIEDKDIIKYFGIPLAKVIKLKGVNNQEEFQNAYTCYYESRHDDMVKVFDGAYETLNELRNAGIKTGIVSSKRRNWLERGMTLLKLNGLLDVVISCEDTDKNKPNPDPIFKACEALGINPEEALMVGDSNFDIECAKNAGSKTCLVKYTILDINKIMELKPDYAVNTLTDILGIVQK